MDITVARVTQLVFRVVMLALVGKAGIDSQHAATIATPLSELVSAGLALAADLLIHSSRFGALASFWESMALDDARKNDLAKTAKALLIAAWIGFALAFASNFTGCAQNETNRAAQGMVLVTTHAQAALALHNAHITTHAQELIIAEDLDAEDAAAKNYYIAIAAGDSAALATAKAGLAAANAVTTAELAKYPTPTTTPATTPAH